MTLRLRLVVALLLLTAVGLALFGVATYSLYARAQHDQLDDQLRSAVPAMSRVLTTLAEAGVDPGTVAEVFGDGDGSRLRVPATVPQGAYAELRQPPGGAGTGTWVAFRRDRARPDLPDRLGDPGPSADLATVGSAEGDVRWRVLAARSPDLPGHVVVVAAPTSGVDRALDRLVLIELAAAAGLLALMALGAWLILRRGLRPLEQMASTAGDINAGDLSPRVTVPGDRSEVGQLGLALNTMLDELEAGFRQRDETEARLRQFLADAAHELRTPLTSIQGFAELLGMEGAGAAASEGAGGGDDVGGRARDGGTGVEGAGPEHRRRAVRRIEQESARMSKLVDDLLLLAHLDRTRPWEPVPVDLAVLAADACDDAVAAEPDGPVRLDAPEPAVVDGDEDHLRQALANLLANARRHTPPGTPVDVRVTVPPDDGPVTVEVRDHGPGLDRTALAHAFDRFWRADPARWGDATGLGLAIVAGIAAEHGGTAEGANADGGGAVFRVRLPRRVSQPAARPAAGRPGPGG